MSEQDLCGAKGAIVPARRRFLRRVGIGVAGAGVLVIGVLVWLWVSATYVPPAYRAVLATAHEEQQRKCDEMLQATANLASDARKSGRWQAAFSAAQINGWLAHDLPRNHPDLLPPELRDPRLVIQPQGITLFAKTRAAGVESVLSLEFSVWIVEPRVIGLRVRRLRAGQLPLPLDSLLKAASDAAANAGYPLRWQQSGGDPVALLHIAPHGEAATAVSIDSIETRDGEIVVAGETRR